MEVSLKNIMVSGYQYRLEFDFNSYYLNFQSDNEQSGAFIMTNYIPLNIQYVKNEVELLEIFDRLPKYRWERIKIKFYGTNFKIEYANEIRALIKEFSLNWRPVAEKLGCLFEWDVSDGLFEHFADEWNQELI